MPNYLAFAVLTGALAVVAVVRIWRPFHEYPLGRPAHAIISAALAILFSVSAVDAWRGHSADDWYVWPIICAAVAGFLAVGAVRTVGLPFPDLSAKPIRRWTRIGGVAVPRDATFWIDAAGLTVGFLLMIWLIIDLESAPPFTIVLAVCLLMLCAVRLAQRVIGAVEAADIGGGKPR
ncbi:MAG TPA: hypothetical protein VG407_11930 [Caulobacteraceae bacterium]|nr:hypothetical protein [Caulobacteraceae bacterium]